jgi:hypothetical protein
MFSVSSTSDHHYHLHPHLNQHHFSSGSCHGFLTGLPTSILLPLHSNLLGFLLPCGLCSLPGHSSLSCPLTVQRVMEPSCLCSWLLSEDFTIYSCSLHWVLLIFLFCSPSFSYYLLNYSISYIFIMFIVWCQFSFLECSLLAGRSCKNLLFSPMYSKHII